MADRKISVLGDGAMATVCALHLDGLGHRVTVWGPFEDHVELLLTARRNDRYLPGIPLPDSLRLTADPAEAAEDAQLIVFAIPTQFMRSVCGRFRGLVPPDVPVISVAKGIENDTLLRPTQVIAEALDGSPMASNRPMAALSGPSIARELSRCLPATLCAAGHDPRFIEDVQALFTTQWLRVYTNPDLPGVELAGATKNVVALAAGILDGLRAGYNAKSALLARGLSEITRLGTAMGAQPETFFGITGVGDLATTCFCPEGRNRTCGELLGRGVKLEEALQQIQGIVEGVTTTRSVMQLAARHDVEMPITAAVHDVLFRALDPIEAIARLMSRSPKRETVG
jgi:glycerol-3-phosphate dehydrogenase (NAD(P)+)